MSKQENKEQQPETEYGKLIGMLRMYEKILHPDLFNPIIQQVAKVYEESKIEGYRNAKISDEALEIENLLIRTRESMGRMPSVKTFHLKCMYKELLEIMTRKEVKS